MKYARYDDDVYWDRRLRHAVRGRDGIAWGTFLVGFLLGAMIF